MDGNNANNYGLVVPNTTNYTYNKEIATIDDIPTATVLWSITPSTSTDLTNIQTITLSDNITNYDYIQIACITNDGTKIAHTFYNCSAGDSLTIVGYSGFNNPASFYTKYTNYSVTNNTTLSFSYAMEMPLKSGQTPGGSYWTNQTRIKPYKIVGYKFN